MSTPEQLTEDPRKVRNAAWVISRWCVDQPDVIGFFMDMSLPERLTVALRWEQDKDNPMVVHFDGPRLITGCYERLDAIAQSVRSSSNLIS